jgi:GT2 family glycosyltransferase
VFGKVKKLSAALTVDSLLRGLHRLLARLRAILPWRKDLRLAHEARAYRKKGQLEASQKVAEAGVRLFPNSLALISECAEIASKQKNWAAAAHHWTKGLDAPRTKADANLFQRIAFALRNQGEYAHADEVLHRGLQKFPAHRSLLKELAALAMAREDWAGAETQWQRILDTAVDETPFEAIISISRARRNAQKLKGAEDILREALVRFPRDVRFLAECATLENYKTPTSAPETRAAKAAPLHAEIVVCVYNALTETEACLEALNAHTDICHSITIVDDGSEPRVRDFLQSYASQAANRRLLINAENQGYTRSANRGLRAAQKDWVVLLNSDALVSKGWLGGLLNCAASDERIRAVGPLSNAAAFQSVPAGGSAFAEGQTTRAEGIERIAQNIRALSSCAYPTVPMLNGFCLMLHKPTLDEVGYLDETNFPYGYGEENDLCFRLLAAGHRLAIADDVYVYHSRSASFGLARRKVLTAAAGKALRRLWPGYTYRHITEVIEDIPALRQLKNAAIDYRGELN